MKVLVAGPGTIGASLALACAVHGHEVALLGRRPETLDAARQRMAEAAAELAAAGLVPATFEGWADRVAPTVDPAEAGRGCGLVIEAINEDLAAKCALFTELQPHLPAAAILSSSTSGLAVDALAAPLADRGRLAVAHFANPPHLMPMVEIVPGQATRPDVVEALAQFVVSLGKTPARLKRDIPGHIFNRIQFAMLREAMALVAADIATPEEIDTVVKRGLALRLAEEGPLEKMDLAGLQLVHDVAAYLFPDLDCARTPALLADMLADGARGASSGRGFYDWDENRARLVLERRNAEVIRHLKRLRT